MSQRNSGYKRKERDLYETPAWVTQCLLPHIPDYVRSVWEPAAGSGKMADVLKSTYDVFQSDIYPAKNLEKVADFLLVRKIIPACQAIITNPPYENAKNFIEHALDIGKADGIFIAMLLRTDYDHAKTRHHLFPDCSAFAKKVVLTKRIVWFEGGKSPSFNHAWFCWDWSHSGPPTISYEPKWRK